MSSSIANMSTFVAVAQAESFAGAARNLGLSTTAASRHVAELESSLGVTLLRRTTRRVSLTEAGAGYLPRAAAILEEIDRLNAETGEASRQLSGTLRVTAPPAIGRDWIVPLAVEFAEAYPEINLEISLAERLVDLLAEGYDAAIRAGPLESSSMIAYKIIDLEYVLCASPQYLERRGTPKTPDDIPDHDWINWLSANANTTWTFSGPGGDDTVPVKSRLLISDFVGLRNAALRGLGLAILPALSVRDDLIRGNLIEVLSEYECYRGTLSLVRPATPFEPTKLRVFIDFITDALRRRAR